MRACFILVITLYTLKALSQDTSRVQYEFGVKLISFTMPVHNFHREWDRYHFNTLQGLFMRISKKTWALRALFYYSEKCRNGFYEVVDPRDLKPRFSSSSDFKILVGWQLYLQDKTEGFYFFQDLYFREFRSSGDYLKDGVPKNSFFKLQSRQLGYIFGSGFRLRVNSILSINPELYAENFFSQSKYYIKDASQNLNNGIYTGKYVMRPAVRIIVTAGF